MDSNSTKTYKDVGKNDANNHNDMAKYLRELRVYIKHYLEEGLSVIPLKYMDKRPLIPWKEYQEKRLSWEDLKKYTIRRINIGIVCGEVSGNLVVLDFDDEEIYNAFKEKHPDIENTRIVKTARGIHAYLKVKGYIPRKQKIGKVDIQGENGYIVAPPSIHPSGAPYQFLKRNPIIDISAEKWDSYYTTILELAKRVTKTPPPGLGRITPATEGWRKLSKLEINRIVEALEKYYIKGYRDYIVMYLSGWLYKAKIDYESAKQVIEILASNDEEKSNRLRVLERTYRNVIPDLKGKSGLQEVLVDILLEKGVSTQQEAEEIAITILNKLQEIMGMPSPARDSVIVALDLETHLYAVANYSSKEIYTVRRTKEGFKKKKVILSGVPKGVVMYIDPFNRTSVWYEFDLELKSGHTRHYGPADFSHIVKALKNAGLIRAPRLGEEVLSSILGKLIEAGRGEIKHETTAPGIYLVDDTLTEVGLNLEAPDTKDLKEALTLLDDLVTNVFKNPEKTAMVIKWGVVAPFSYVKKTLYPIQGIVMPWLYLYGPSQAGKTTVGSLIVYMWGQDPMKYVIPFSKLDTVARMGQILSSSTMPYVIKEVGSIFRNEDLLDMMKSAIESQEARGKYIEGQYTPIPALAPLCFTSNKERPRDDAILERFIVISYTQRETYSYEERERFRKKYLPQLRKLKVIGEAVYLAMRAAYIQEGPEFFKKNWEEIAEMILKGIYEIVGLDPPEWITYHYEEENDLEEDIVDNLRAWFIEEINRAWRNVDYALKTLNTEQIQGISNIDDLYSYEYENFKRKVLLVFGEMLIPWGGLKTIKDVTYVVIYRSIINRLPWPLQNAVQGRLTALVDLLKEGGLTIEYTLVRVPGSNPQRVGLVPLMDFVKFLKRGEYKIPKIEEWEVGS